MVFVQESFRLVLNLKLDCVLLSVEVDRSCSPLLEEGTRADCGTIIGASVVFAAQVVLEADWPISHCLTPHRVRSGAAWNVEKPICRNCFV